MTTPTQLRIGQSPPVELTLDEGICVGSLTDATTDQIDVAVATRAALESPYGFPSLNQALTPGDLIAIAIGEGLREPAQVVRGVVDFLKQAEIRNDSIVIVAGNQADADRLRPQIEDLVAEGCRLVGHDPTDEHSLGYVAAVNEKPLMMNRELFEADLVIPVGCARLVESRDYRGPFDALFPRFGDHETICQYAQGDGLDSPTAGARRRRQTEQAGWKLSAPLVLQVVPGHGGGVADVVAGAPEEVAQVIAKQCETLWRVPVGQRASLVVATLTGGPEEQTWQNVARALFAASLAVDDEASAVAICTDLDEPLGESLSELIAAGGELERATQIGDQTSPDAAAAWELYKALSRGPVFFMSQLNEGIVENLGMARIASNTELQRLVEQSQSCLLLDEAQHAVPVFVETE